jgi:hypothetical protein
LAVELTFIEYESLESNHCTTVLAIQLGIALIHEHLTATVTGIPMHPLGEADLEVAVVLGDARIRFTVAAAEEFAQSSPNTRYSYLQLPKINSLGGGIIVR